jgi:hypothetical protein
MNDRVDATMPRKPGRQFFANPGPSNIPDPVLRAMDRPTIDFNDPEFMEVYVAAVAGLKRVLGESMQAGGVLTRSGQGTSSRDEGGLVANLTWRVKLVAERQPGVTTETELARIERDEQAGLADLGLTLAEAKRLTAALQAQIVPAQVAAMGEIRRACVACGRRLASKGYHRARFRSLFGDVPVRVRRWLVCPCRGGEGERKSVAALDLGKDAVAPELAYVTARYAALVPFGKVAALLSELLPLGGAQHASTARNRTLRVGARVVQGHSAEEAVNRPAAQVAGPVAVGLDGGYVRCRHGGKGRHFEVAAGKVIDAGGAQHRFAFVRDGKATAAAFRQTLAAAGMGADTPAATVLCDGDAGLWRLQRRVLPGATPVLDWWHAAVRFEHALQAARSLGAGARTADTSLVDRAVRGLERAKWRMWRGRWPGCRRGLAVLCRWAERRALRAVAGIGKLRQHVADLLGFLERNEAALVPYAARRRRGEPISTAFVESTVNEVVAKRMNKAQQMRWSRATVQPVLAVRTAVLNGTLEHTFRHRHPGFRPANDDRRPTAAAA